MKALIPLSKHKVSVCHILGFDCSWCWLKEGIVFVYLFWGLTNKAIKWFLKQFRWSILIDLEWKYLLNFGRKGIWTNRISRFLNTFQNKKKTQYLYAPIVLTLILILRVLTDCSLIALWVLSEYSLSALWVFSECSMSAIWVLSECSMTADLFLTYCLKIWARMMKIYCSRQTWNERTNGRTSALLELLSEPKIFASSWFWSTLCCDGNTKTVNCFITT